MTASRWLTDKSMPRGSHSSFKVIYVNYEQL